MISEAAWFGRRPVKIGTVGPFRIFSAGRLRPGAWACFRLFPGGIFTRGEDIDSGFFGGRSGFGCVFLGDDQPGSGLEREQGEEQGG
jgi:hypothetical protein